jgi:hypothetical protein
MAQINDILAVLSQLRQKGLTKKWIDPENTWCATFEGRDFDTKGNPFWLQIFAGSLNMQYLDEDEPSARLASEVVGFPRDGECVAWEACDFATFRLPSEGEQELPGLIDRIFRQYFGLSEGYVLQARLGNTV